MRKVYNFCPAAAWIANYILFVYQPMGTITWGYKDGQFAVIWSEFEDYLNTIELFERIKEYYS